MIINRKPELGVKKKQEKKSSNIPSPRFLQKPRIKYNLCRPFGFGASLQVKKDIIGNRLNTSIKAKNKYKINNKNYDKVSSSKNSIIPRTTEIANKWDIIPKVKKGLNTIFNNTNINSKFTPYYQYTPAIKQWFNSVYSFNKNLIKNLPAVDILVLRILRSYFSIHPIITNPWEKKSNFTQKRSKKLSLNKIFVSKPEIKHNNNKVLITVYLYNKKKKSMIYLLKNLYKSLQIRLKAFNPNFKNKNIYKAISLKDNKKTLKGLETEKGSKNFFFSAINNKSLLKKNIKKQRNGELFNNNKYYYFKSLDFKQNNNTNKKYNTIYKYNLLRYFLSKQNKNFNKIYINAFKAVKNYNKSVNNTKKTIYIDWNGLMLANMSKNLNFSLNKSYSLNKKYLNLKRLTPKKLSNNKLKNQVLKTKNKNIIKGSINKGLNINNITSKVKYKIILSEKAYMSNIDFYKLSIKKLNYRLHRPVNNTYLSENRIKILVDRLYILYDTIIRGYDYNNKTLYNNIKTILILNKIFLARQSTKTKLSINSKYKPFFSRVFGNQPTITKTGLYMQPRFKASLRPYIKSFSKGYKAIKNNSFKQILNLGYKKGFKLGQKTVYKYISKKPRVKKKNINLIPLKTLNTLYINPILSTKYKLIAFNKKKKINKFINITYKNSFFFKKPKGKKKLKYIKNINYYNILRNSSKKKIIKFYFKNLKPYLLLSNTISNKNNLNGINSKKLIKSYLKSFNKYKVLYKDINYKYMVNTINGNFNNSLENLGIIDLNKNKIGKSFNYIIDSLFNINKLDKKSILFNISRNKLQKKKLSKKFKQNLKLKNLRKNINTNIFYSSKKINNLNYKNNKTKKDPYFIYFNNNFRVFNNKPIKKPFNGPLRGFKSLNMVKLNNLSNNNNNIMNNITMYKLKMLHNIFIILFLKKKQKTNIYKSKFINNRNLLNYKNIGEDTGYLNYRYNVLYYNDILWNTHKILHKASLRPHKYVLNNNVIYSKKFKKYIKNNHYLKKKYINLIRYNNKIYNIKTLNIWKKWMKSLYNKQKHIRKLFRLNIGCKTNFNIRTPIIIKNKGNNKVKFFKNLNYNNNNNIKLLAKKKQNYLSKKSIYNNNTNYNDNTINRINNNKTNRLLLNNINIGYNKGLKPLWGPKKINNKAKHLKPFWGPKNNKYLKIRKKSVLFTGLWAKKHNIAFRRIDKFIDNYTNFSKLYILSNDSINNVNILSENSLISTNLNNNNKISIKDININNKSINVGNYGIKWANNYLKKINKLNYISTVFENELLYIYQIKTITYNTIIFKSWFINILINILSKIYNKKVNINLISLKYIHLNSDILIKAIVNRFRNKAIKQYNAFLTILKIVKMHKLNLSAFNFFSKQHKYLKSHFSQQKFSYILDYLHIYNNNSNNINKVHHLWKSKNIYNLNFKSFINKKNNKYLYYYNKKHFNFNIAYDNIINFIKYKTILGFKIQTKGRLSKRAIASRSVFKVKYKGTMKNNIYLNKANSKLLYNNKTSNMQFTKISSKIRTGAFGVKGWINNG